MLLIQFVTLIRDGKAVQMSTRSGEFTTLREVLDEVGADAARFFYLLRSYHTHLDFDLTLAKTQSRNNPVYYIQYVHARISSIFREAEERGEALGEHPPLSILTLPEETHLKSALGMGSRSINQYHNLKRPADQEAVFATQPRATAFVPSGAGCDRLARSASNKKSADGRLPS